MWFQKPPPSTPPWRKRGPNENAGAVIRRRAVGGIPVVATGGEMGHDGGISDGR